MLAEPLAFKPQYYCHASPLYYRRMAALERLSISMSPSDRALIESAAKAAGVSVSAWMVHAAREEARWAMAAEIASEIAAEVGVTTEDRAWAAQVLGVDADGR